jgi:hypothetical protein
LSAASVKTSEVLAEAFAGVGDQGLGLVVDGGTTTSFREDMDR